MYFDSFLFGNSVLFGYAASFEQEGDKIKVARGLLAQQLVAAFGLFAANRSKVLNADNSVVIIIIEGVFLVVSLAMGFGSSKTVANSETWTPRSPVKPIFVGLATPQKEAKAPSAETAKAPKSPRASTPKAPKSPRAGTPKAAPKSPRASETPKAAAATPKTPARRRSNW